MDLIFGNLAVLIPRGGMVDPWLCVPAFQQVCYYRILFVRIITKAYQFPPFISAIPNYKIEMLLLFFRHRHNKQASPTRVSICFNTCLENGPALTHIRSIEHFTGREDLIPIQISE
jgi:hypothetical protein